MMRRVALSSPVLLRFQNGDEVLSARKIGSQRMIRFMSTTRSMLGGTATWT